MILLFLMPSSFSTVATVDCIFQQLNHDLFIAVLLGSWFQTTTGKRKKIIHKM
jgi:hypothetical protein